MKFQRMFATGAVVVLALIMLAGRAGTLSNDGNGSWQSSVQNIPR